MTFLHTSPSTIIEINAFGRFGEFLFFTADAPYVMTAGNYVTYSLELDENQIIDAESLFYHQDAEKLSGLVHKVVALVGCDEDMAEELIAQRADIHSIDCDIEPEDLAEVSWDIQRIAGEAALLLGFAGVAMDDEQGRAYLINMADRVSQLEEVAQ
ncbi:AcrIF11 family anti-CRISPR ADP-ribosyltransferase [Halomonas sp. MS1]|nr:hypothetical protein [Halomonas sp. MS1]UTD54940.1 hypothetical protein NF683_17605 [Halomonas sp. MS1]